MSTPTFAATYNLIAFLEKSIESNGFEQIVDFQNANPIKYALTRKHKSRRKQRKETEGRIAEIDADEDLSLINETIQDQGRMNNENLFGVNDLDGDKLIVDVPAGENVEQVATIAEKEVSAAADEVVTTAESVEDITAATTPQISMDDVTLAQTLIEIKVAKPKAKGKDQIALDEGVARKLEAEMKAEIDEEERITREKDEANIAVIEEWDDVQATIDVDRQLAEQL
nr:hypothetical protein [Tanacetum cinerariifolium]